MTHEIIIALIMIITGAVGGAANFLSDDNLKFECRTIAKSLVLGISASVMVPLFLSMISSNLLVESSTSAESYFVLAGFCMVASIFSRSFIDGVSSKVLNDLQKKTDNIDKKVENYEEHVKPLIERSEEPEIESNEIYDLRVREVAPSLKELDLKIISAIDESKYTIRTAGGIAQQLGMVPNSRETVRQRLRALSDMGVVSELNGLDPKSSKPRWYLTNLGRAALRNTRNASDERA
ncbi:YEATS-associated helix-containing protein [Shewanella algae]|uniref:YEATS-associated helix-containing protein n=1 Tax=Shewanella algae TaxID=38313 RepID=UPI0031F4A01F